MAAAEGVVVLEAARLGPLLGLTSVLLLRERKLVREFVATAALRCGGRAGEASREESELEDEGGPDTLRPRAPATVLGGIDAGAAAASVEGFGLASAGVSWAGAASAGSADSRTPEMEWKPSAVEVMIWDD